MRKRTSTHEPQSIPRGRRLLVGAVPARNWCGRLRHKLLLKEQVGLSCKHRRGHPGACLRVNWQRCLSAQVSPVAANGHEQVGVSSNHSVPIHATSTLRCARLLNFWERGRLSNAPCSTNGSCLFGPAGHLLEVGGILWQSLRHMGVSHCPDCPDRSKGAAAMCSMKPRARVFTRSNQV